MKLRSLSQYLVLGSLCVNLAPAYAHADGPTDAVTAVSGFFHHLFGHHQAPLVQQTNNDDSDTSSDVSATPIPLAAPLPSSAPSRNVIIPYRVPIINDLSESDISLPIATPVAFDSCSEMQVGESRVIDYPIFTPEINAVQVFPRYLLNRVADNANGKASYEAAVQVKFIPKAGENLDVQAMLDYTNTCYANLPPIESQNGESLKIRMALPGEAAPARAINLTGVKLPREDMVNWSTQSNCRTLVHETLHLLGLVDLYHEPEMKTATGSLMYDCRKTGPVDSVMDDLGKAHFSKEQYMHNSCTCETTSCANELAQLTSTPDACPSLASQGQPFPINISEYDISTDKATAQFFDINYRPYLQAGELVDRWSYYYYSLTPDNHPFLYPAEFRVIISPACHEKNSLYYACAANAYRTSTDPSTTTRPEGCSVTPSACDNPNQWLQ
jgi:hypothetical protein